jgi:hypothetical protein
MIELSQAQHRIFKKMRGYRVVAQLETGAVLLASRANKKAMVIDTDGRQFSFRHYLEQVGEREQA